MKKISSTSEKIISVLIIAFAFLFPHYAGFPFFSYTIIVLLIIWLFLKYISKESFKDIFFSFKNFQLKAIWQGAVVAIILFALLQYVIMPLLQKIIPNQTINLHDYDFIKGNFVNYILVLIAALIVGGFYEELVFHGFIFTRLEKIFNTHKTVIAFTLTAIIFAAYHFQQGILGMINAGIAGCAYHAFILKNNRNLWYGIFFHAFYDFIGLSFIYAGHH
ncbi:MAG TPA: type II CAAX endopeptidase family protein [Parafilimonas sp.]|nr:type II CAAX endopeptidase family protein [Parafilimonas sp.]